MKYSKKDQLKSARVKKKRKGSTKNLPYFLYLRENMPECGVCGDLGEIHHIEFGYKRCHKRVVMLCNHHHSAQSMDGLHYNPSGWYRRFLPFAMLEKIAEEAYSGFVAGGGGEIG